MVNNPEPKMNTNKINVNVFEPPPISAERISNASSGQKGPVVVWINDLINFIALSTF